MQQWYYTLDNKQHGPIFKPELVRFFESGELTPDTMVWTEGMEQWAVARDVDGLIAPTYKPPPLPTPPPSIATTPTKEHAISGKQVRPWVRYWARMVDYSLFSCLAGILLAIIYSPALEMPAALFGFLVLFVYIFFEPTMLATWGTTPGKALLRVRLRNRDGSKLSYSNALNRAFKVWFRGEGLGLPIVVLLTNIVAYNVLTEQGITSWDEDGNFKVTHQPVGAWRTIAAIIILIGMLFLMALGNADI